jgi:hypothetical protein
MIRFYYVCWSVVYLNQCYQKLNWSVVLKNFKFLIDECDNNKFIQSEK